MGTMKTSKKEIDEYLAYYQQEKNTKTYGYKLRLNK